MIERYSKEPIAKIWSDENKLMLWQKVEIAVIRGRETLARVLKETAKKIETILKGHPINIAWWKERDKEIHHDQQAAVEERQQFLSPDLASEYHKETTSYDTEEPAMAEMLETSARLAMDSGNKLRKSIEEKALKYRFTPMLARTHNQWAQIQSFGFECLTWHEDLGIPLATISNVISLLRFTKCSGAVGNNAEIDPILEREALAYLGRAPWHGATQIMPRALYAQLSSGLAQLVTQCAKIAGDIRLASGSGRKTLEEPFNPKQKGSTAMPAKRNPIRTEQICGIARAARGYGIMLEENIETWESRSIEQSCVERIAWPDLFHVTLHALEVLTKVIQGLNVYPDMMMREIAMSAGTYASNAAKTFLAKHGATYGITPDDAYGIVRLASHIAFEPPLGCELIRNDPPSSTEEVDGRYEEIAQIFVDAGAFPESIEHIIGLVRLHERPDIGVSQEMIIKWNEYLANLFSNSTVRSEWHKLFSPSRGMMNERYLFKQVFGK